MLQQCTLGARQAFWDDFAARQSLEVDSFFKISDCMKYKASDRLEVDGAEWDQFLRYR